MTSNVRSQELSLGVLLVVLVASLVLINPWARAEEVRVERAALKGFPDRVGEWKQRGMDERFDAASEDVLNSDDYLLRTYTAPDGGVASMFVGYYTNLEFNSNYHSPTVCLPGSGWVITPQEDVLITPAGGVAPFSANAYLVQKGDERLFMLYWYQGRGRFLTSDVWTKVYSTLDGLSRRRADGAIVRVVVPIKDSQPTALEASRRFAAEMVPLLAPYVPL